MAHLGKGDSALPLSVGVVFQLSMTRCCLACSGTVQCAVIVLFVLTVSPVIAMAKSPDAIEFGVQWCVHETAPGDLQGFIETVKRSNREMLGELSWFHLIRLLNAFEQLKVLVDTELNHLFVKYTYAVEESSGNWKDVEQTIEIRSKSSSMNRGELLFRLHHLIKDNLRGNDHCFPEGLYLERRTVDEPIPTYELFLGS